MRNKRQKKPEEEMSTRQRNQRMELKGMKPINNKKLSHFLIIASTMLSLCILSLFKAHYCPAPHVNSKESLKLQNDLKMVTEEEDMHSFFQDDEDDEGPGSKPDRPKPICYESSLRSDTCEAIGDIRVDSGSRIAFLNTSRPLKIKPYTRKSDSSALATVSEWTLQSLSPAPRCTENYTSPALIFSVGGFTGNLFHDFSDVLIPLYLTSRHFHGEAHFLVSDAKPWWLHRFNRILSRMSNHDIIDITQDEHANIIRCYQKITVGLKFETELGSVDNQTMSNFRAMLRQAFRLNRSTIQSILVSANNKKPRLLIISRKQSRAIVNEPAIVAMAKILGFDVAVCEDGADMEELARMANEADVMVGVYGAGLTNMVYMPARAVVVQVIPLGGLEWLARDKYKGPALGMGLRYLEYLINDEESTLIEEYKRDDPVIKDPKSIHKQGWEKLRELYLDKQNVRVNLGRMRGTLLEAMNLLQKK